jgi:hypothetical protein
MPSGDGGPGDGPGAETGPSYVSCQTYCAALQSPSGCPDNPESKGDCNALCAFFFPSGAGGTTSGDDPLDCRLGWLTQLTLPPPTRCSKGGFNGGGFCGLNDSGPTAAFCDTYCGFAAAACNTFDLTPTVCQQECETLTTLPLNATYGDNISCRIGQLVIAAGLPADQRASICALAAISPTTGPCM